MIRRAAFAATLVLGSVLAAGAARADPPRPVAKMQHFTLGVAAVSSTDLSEDGRTRVGAGLFADAQLVPRYIDVSLSIAAVEDLAAAVLLFKVPIRVSDLAIPWVGVGGVVSVDFADDGEASAGGAGGVGVDVRLLEAVHLRIEAIADWLIVPELSVSLGASLGVFTRI